MSIFKQITCILAVIVISSCSRAPFASTDETCAFGSDAREMIDFPLVKSATNFSYYENVGGMQFLDRFIRFRVQPSDVAEQIKMIKDDNNQKFGRSLPYLQTNLAFAEIIEPVDKKTVLRW